MHRRRFLVVAAAVSTALFAPRQTLAASTVTSVRIIRGQRQLLVGAPGRCAGARRASGIGALLPHDFLALALDR